MSVPLQILGRSFRLMAAQPVQTVRVIAPGIVISALGTGFLLHGIGGSQRADDVDDLPLFLLGLLFVLAGWMTFAIFWHRPALLQDTARTEVMCPGRWIFWRYFNAAAMVGLAITLGILQGLIQSLIYISVLSTLYGHLIERRLLT